MILKPNFDLCWCKSDDTGQMFSFRCTQVSLLSEPSFQLISLRLAEKNSSFALLGITQAPTAVATSAMLLRWCGR